MCLLRGTDWIFILQVKFTLQMVKNTLRRYNNVSSNVELKHVPSITFGREVLSPEIHFHHFPNSIKRSK